MKIIMKDKIERAIDLQGELDSIIQEIRPKLVKFAEKKHRKLGETIEDVRFYSDSICFTAGGYAMGYFEDSFEMPISELS